MTDAPLEVTDARGRKISLRVMNPAEMLDLLEAAGSASTNAGWLRYAMVVYSVQSIDGVPVPAPTRKEHIRKMAETLGNDGFAAASEALFGGDNAEQATADTAKN